MLPYFAGESTEKLPPPHDALYWRFGPQRAIRQGDWKLTQARGETSWKLFNLASDISESQDLAAEQPARLKDMSEKWDAWNTQLVEPKWGAPAAKAAKQAKQAAKGKKKAAQK